MKLSWVIRMDRTLLTLHFNINYIIPPATEQTEQTEHKGNNHTHTKHTHNHSQTLKHDTTSFLVLKQNY